MLPTLALSLCLSSLTSAVLTTAAVPAPAPAAEPVIVAPRAEAPVVGAPFGPLQLPTVDRAQVLSLDSFRGRKLLLLEFASW